MQDPMAMAVTNALDKLRHELLDHPIAESESAHVQVGPVGQRLSAAALAHGESLHVLLQVEVEVLHDKVELVAVCVDDVEETDNVRVVHLLEERDLADRGARDALILGFQADLLESNDAAGMGQVARLVDNSVGTCSRYWLAAVCLVWREGSAEEFVTAVLTLSDLLNLLVVLHDSGC